MVVDKSFAFSFYSFGVNQSDTSNGETLVFVSA